MRKMFGENKLHFKILCVNKVNLPNIFYDKKNKDNFFFF